MTLREKVKESSIVGRKDVCTSTKEKELVDWLTSVHSPMILKSPFTFPKERAKANGALDRLVAQPRQRGETPQEVVALRPQGVLAHEVLVPDQ